MQVKSAIIRPAVGILYSALYSAYINRHDLGGIMFWELALNTYQDGLLDVIHKTLWRARKDGQ